MIERKQRAKVSAEAEDSESRNWLQATSNRTSADSWADKLEWGRAEETRRLSTVLRE